MKYKYIFIFVLCIIIVYIFGYHINTYIFIIHLFSKDTLVYI